MHPKKKYYRVDNEYLKLKKYKAKLLVNVLGIPFKVNRKYYESIYGPTLKMIQGITL